MSRQYTIAEIKNKIRVIPDFPKQGISFKDISTLVKDGKALREIVQILANRFKDKDIKLVVGIEARGYLIGAPVAYELGSGFVLVRKPGKLPSDVCRVTYELEYGEDSLEIHKDAIKPGDKVLIIDDLLATGGTVRATADLVLKLGGKIEGIGLVIELTGLNGREKLSDCDVFSIIKYEY